MKLPWIFLALFLIISAPVFADTEIEIVPLQDTYYSGENIQAWILVHQEPLQGFSIGNVLLYDEAGNKVSSLLSIKRGEAYFVYGKFFPQKTANYSLGIRGLKYEENGILQEKDFLKAVEIREEKAVTLSPFGLFEEGKEMILTAKNTGSKEKQVSLILPTFLSALRNPLDIPLNTEKKFFLPQQGNPFPANITAEYHIEHANETLNRSYIIPVFTPEFVEINETQKNESRPFGKKLVFVDHAFLNKTFERKTTLHGELKIRNEGEDINFSISLEKDLIGIALINQTIFSLAAGENASVLLTINKEKNPAQQSYEGNLLIPEANLSFPIFLTVKPGEQKKEPAISFNETEEVFEEEQQPTINISEYFKDEEEKRQKHIQTGFITFILLVVLVGIFLIFFKILRKPVNPPERGIGDIAKKRNS